jgi:hypothetical protein
MVTIQGVTGFLKDNATTIGVGIGGVALGATLGALAVSKSTKSRKRSSTTSRKRKSNRSNKRSKKSSRGPRTPHTAGKRRDTSTRRIRVTKNGQPYVILASGKARFISKKSAKASRKRKGGRY